MKQKLELSPETSTIEWLSQGREALAHPADVISDPHMSKSEKRALLASWASDVRAVEDAPTCRQLDSGAIVQVSEIMQALRSLDAEEPSRHHGSTLFPYFARRPYWLLSRLRHRAGRRRNGSDDDNNPPTCPAAAQPLGRKSVPADGGWGARPEWA